MQPFTIFQTGGRQKFLKKKKQKKSKTQQQYKQEKNILILQKNIRRFLQYKQVYDHIENSIQIENQDITMRENKKYFNYWILTQYHVKNHNLETRIVEYWKDTMDDNKLCQRINFQINKARSNRMQLQKQQIQSSQIFQQDQKHKNSPVLLQKMTKLTVRFLSQLFQHNFQQTTKITKFLFRLMQSNLITINQPQIKQIRNCLTSNKSKKQLQQLWKQLIDIIIKIKNSQTSEMFQNQTDFYKYLFIVLDQQKSVKMQVEKHNQKNNKMKNSYDNKKEKVNKQLLQKIVLMIIQYYPKIYISMFNSQNQVQNKVETDQHARIILNGFTFDQYYYLYELLLDYLYSITINPKIEQQSTQSIRQSYSATKQNTVLSILCFLSNLTQKLHSLIVYSIQKKYNINQKLFQSQFQYSQYLSQKQQFIQYQQKMVLFEYEKNKLFLQQIILNIVFVGESQKRFQENKNELISNNKIYDQQSTSLMRQSAIKYIFQLLSIYTQSSIIIKDIIPLKESIDYLLKNISQTSIYNLGKSNQVALSYTNSTEKKQKYNQLVYSENLLLLILTIIHKSCLSTPDLYFIKYYQTQQQKDKIKKIVKQYLLKLLKHTIFLTKINQQIKKITKVTIQILQNLYNKIFRTNILSTDIFQNASFIMKFKNYQFKKHQSNDEVQMFLNKFPYVFPLQLRAWKFRDILREQRYRYQYYPPAHMDNDDSDDDYGYFNAHVKIRRNYQFIDAFQKLKKQNLRKNFSITFINQLGFEQKGIDAGGLKKQFLNRVLKNVLNPQYGMFIQNHAKQLLPHPLKAQLNQGIQTQYYQFIGKLIGLAIYENITLGYKFAGSFLNAIVGKKNSFDDLRLIDNDLYKSLIYIKDMKQDAKQLCLNFMYKDQTRNKHILLLPEGYNIEVTNQNKLAYISLLTNYKVNKVFEHQTRFIRKGLMSMIDKEWLFMFNYVELNYIISGQGQINIQELKQYTKSVTIKYFWQIVRQFTQQQKSKLLMFVTACPRPSFLGFKQLSPPFTIVKVKDNQTMLPISHTCSNVLELPDYKDKEILRKKLLTAIQSNAGFEFG